MLPTDLGHMCFTIKLEICPQLRSSSDITLFEYWTWHAVISRHLRLFPQLKINLPMGVLNQCYVLGPRNNVPGLLYQLQWLKLGMYMTNSYSMRFWPWWGLFTYCQWHLFTVPPMKPVRNVWTWNVEEIRQMMRSVPFLIYSWLLSLQFTYSNLLCVHSWRISHLQKCLPSLKMCWKTSQHRKWLWNRHPAPVTMRALNLKM